MSDEIETAQLLLNCDADPQKHDHDGRFVLSFASMHGNFGMVKILVQHMSHLDAVNHNGRTSLMGAASAGSSEIVQYLVENGADPNIPDRWGETALHEAASRGHTSIVEYLIALPAAELEIREEFGRTASNWARQRGKEDIADLIDAEIARRRAQASIQASA
ncbi:hypothetical protein LTS18_010778 [Coniosporium uncinatum]|uniref:Uncharacterized protein n=1 Tax=Coniosporium uncinatum TaxID=93489 RepID=A0ACC3DW85_9PEZI|nr:hypothetical protein LTS18_010778 [Coniosporium uncinatum]